MNRFCLFFAFFCAAAEINAHERPVDQLSEGFSFLEKGETERAEKIFLPFTSSETAQIRSFAILGLSQAALQKGDLKRAEELLDETAKEDFSPFQELEYEWLFTKGHLYFEKQEFAKSIEWLEKALPKKNIEQSPWKEKTSALLAKAHHQLAEKGKQRYLLGELYFQNKDFILAEQEFEGFLKDYPNSPLAPKALYFSARALEEAGKDPEKKRAYYKRLYENYPQNPLAEDSYFFCYSPQEYLMGNRASIKHLQGFKSRFPNSPLLLTALYLQGLDDLHDRRSSEGKWIQRVNLIEAIERFQEVETLFERLEIPPSELPKFKTLRDAAMLERAKANLKIGEQSKATKQAIYYDYAKEVFKTLIERVKDTPMHPIEEEGRYYLALVQVLSKEDAEAEKTMLDLEQKYRKQGIATSYFLSRTLYQKGKLKAQHGDYKMAIALFNDAMKAGSPNFLTTDETLEMLIEKGEAFKRSGDLDQAMAELSLAVNYEAVSSLRLKAMYLRASIYELQGRKALGQKQLESLSLKGGEWGEKAREKLDKEYRFD